MDTVFCVSAWSAAHCNHYNWQRCCHNAITLIPSGTILCTSVVALDLLIHFQSGNAPLLYLRPVWKRIKHSSLPHPIIQMTKHRPFILIMGPSNQDWETPSNHREVSMPLCSPSSSPFWGLSCCIASWKSAQGFRGDLQPQRLPVNDHSEWQGCNTLGVPSSGIERGKTLINRESDAMELVSETVVLTKWNDRTVDFISPPQWPVTKLLPNKDYNTLRLRFSPYFVWTVSPETVCVFDEKLST